MASALTASGATALLVTHDQSEALAMGAEVAVLRGGVVAQIATPEMLYRQPVDVAMARFVGEAVILRGTVLAGEATCALGRLPLARPAPDGPADVMVRPEQIRFSATPNAETPRGLVLAVTYYGQDASVRLALAGRAGDDREPRPGPSRAETGRRGSPQRRRRRDGLSARSVRQQDPASARPALDREIFRKPDERRGARNRGEPAMTIRNHGIGNPLRSAVCASALAAALVPCAAGLAAQPGSFLDSIHRQTTLTTTVPDNGDQNPYAIVVAPVSAGVVQKDDVLVTNFNNDGNLQGLGTTIVAFNPATKKLTTFASLPRTLAGCPGGVGLTTAMTMLKSGWVIVGSAPSSDGTTGTKGPGCLIVLDANGKVANVIANDAINMPWGNMATLDEGDSATIFVSNTGFGVGSPDGDPRVVNQQTVVRLKLAIKNGEPPSVVSQTVVGSGFGAQPSKDAFVVGPTGLALGSDGTLYVSDATGNRINAIWDATTRDHTAGVGRTVTKDGLLQRPLAMAWAPNGHLLVTNAQNGQVVEIDPASGDQIKARWIDPNKAQKPPGSGDLFGIAMTPAGDGFYFVEDENNTLVLAK